jgi:hypothetical protein
VAGESYVIFIRAAAGSAVTSGNYVVTVNFATDAASLTPVFSGSVAGAQQDSSQLRVAKTQLYRFDLAAQAAAADVGVQLSLYDARTGAVVASFAAAAGSTRTEYVWLPQGDYVILATHRSRSGATAAPVAFTLLAAAISDDQGPNPIDPTDLPTPDAGPDWIWTDHPDQPLIIDELPPLEDPWAIWDYNEYEVDYYLANLA